MQTYHRCTSILERELGVAPDRATTAEYERLASGQPPAVARVAPAAALARMTGPVQAASPLRLVGREHELALLQERWDQAMAGLAGFVLVTGEAGVGKSRLLDELSSLVQRAGSDAMRARCFAARGRLALAPVSEWLRSPPLRSARDRLEPVWAREVDRLVPSAAADPMALPRPMADAWQRHRFLEGLARAVLSAGRPALLVLDDLQWCDEDTLAWLQLLLHLGQGHPLLVLAAARPQEAEGNAELTETLRALRSAGQVTDVDLAPLDSACSAELAGEVLGTVPVGRDAQRLYAATGGYPLFVIESIRAWQLGRPAGPPAPGDQPAPATDDTGPGDLDSSDPGPRVRAVLTDRIRQAGSAARQVAELAAVIGRDFSLDLLTEASDLDSDAVVGAVDELWRRRIIREHAPASYDFFHDLLRDAAYGEISPPRRALLHRRVAQALELTHADDPAAAAAIAYHYEGPAARPARCRITCRPRKSPRACLRTRRPSATTGGPPSYCGRPQPAASAMPGSWPSCWPWARRSPRSTATPRPNWNTPSNVHATLPSSEATPGCSCSSSWGCSASVTCRGTSPSPTRSPTAAWS